MDPAKLAFEIALGYHTPDDLCTQFGIEPELLAALRQDPRFQRVVLAYKREIDEQGTEFQVKARKLSSLVVEELGAIALNPLATASDRISAIRELARFAGYAAIAENPVQKPTQPMPPMPSDPAGIREYTLAALAEIVRNVDGRASPSDRLAAMREISRLNGDTQGLTADTPPIQVVFMAPTAPAQPEPIDVTPTQPSIQ